MFNMQFLTKTHKIQKKQGNVAHSKEHNKSLESDTKETQASGASMVAQWLRICLLMQGTRVRALVWEDPTCRRTAGPMSHNY